MLIDKFVWRNSLNQDLPHSGERRYAEILQQRHFPMADCGRVDSSVPNGLRHFAGGRKMIILPVPIEFGRGPNLITEGLFVVIRYRQQSGPSAIERLSNAVHIGAAHRPAAKCRVTDLNI